MTRMLGVSLLTLGDPDTLTGGYLYHRRMAEAAPDHGARVHFVSVPDAPFPLTALGGGAALARACGSGTDVLVLDSIAAAAVGPSLVRRRPRLPLVAILHQPPGGIDHGPVRTTLQAALDRLAYRRAARLLVASESLADELSRTGFRRDLLVVVPPGRDVAAAESAPEDDDLRRGRKAAFLCVGNWVARKGVLDLLQAFSSLDFDAATLHLVGETRADPTYAAKVAARLSRADLTDRAVVHGPPTREPAAGLYRRAEAFLLASTREPYGTVNGESMAAGLPVVAWRAGNLPYLARDCEEGIVLEPGAVTGLAAALGRLAADDALRRRMGAAARRRALTLPTWKDTAERFFGAIREVAEAP